MLCRVVTLTFSWSLRILSGWANKTDLGGLPFFHSVWSELFSLSFILYRVWLLSFSILTLEWFTLLTGCVWELYLKGDGKYIAELSPSFCFRELCNFLFCFLGCSFCCFVCLSQPPCPFWWDNGAVSLCGSNSEGFKLYEDPLIPDVGKWWAPMENTSMNCDVLVRCGVGRERGSYKRFAVKCFLISLGLKTTTFLQGLCQM